PRSEPGFRRRRAPAPAGEPGRAVARRPSSRSSNRRGRYTTCGGDWPPAWALHRSCARLLYWPRLRTKRVTNPRPVSTTQKKAAAISTMMKTITEVIQVSLRLGHTILRASARTWLMNCGIDVFFLGAGASTATVAAPGAAAAVWFPAVRRPPGVFALAI